MTRLSVRSLLHVFVSASLAAASASASAMDVDVAGVNVRIENLFTVGAMFRMQERDASLLGKSNNQPGLCVRRNPSTGAYLQEDASKGEIDAACSNSNFAAAQKYVEAPGLHLPNSDNGNLNFDKGEIVHANAKLTSDITFDLYDFNVFVRPIMFFDDSYANLRETHPDTTLQPARTNFPGGNKEHLGTDFDVLDYHISRVFSLGDIWEGFGEREVSVKIGNQVLNWGESAFLLLNSLNSINPPDASRLRVPGFDVKELAIPLGMVTLGTEVIENVNVEAFYQYEWKPTVADPVGSFFSQSDTLGPGGRYGMLGNKSPEDPDNVYNPKDNPDDGTGTLGSTSGRTVFRDFAEEKRRLPDDGGQYGAAVKLFLEDFNNGTEVGFYFANYHARIPSVSFFAGQDTCITDAASLFAAAPAGCGLTPSATPGRFNAAREPLPIDTVRLAVEYPEDIKMYGISFNTTVGDWALAGEYAYRTNLPIQINSTDLTFAALQPVFPAQDVYVGSPAVAVIPGRRSALPDFTSVYRRGLKADGTANTYQAGEYIQGFERLKIGQLNTTLLKTIGGDNPINASQITFLLELGMTNMFDDFPDVDELQFQGALQDTHISHGHDGSKGILPLDQRGGPMEVLDNGETFCPGTSGGSQPDPENDANPRCLRLNPIAQERDAFGTKISYGYRLIFLPRWDSALFGANIEYLTGFFHDVEGVAPGLGQNFIEGRKQIIQGIRFDYLSKFIGEVRYTWFTGGGALDATRDRDNLFVTVGYLY